MAENVFVPNPEEFEQVKSKIYSEGAENLHVVADFDRTLTKLMLMERKFLALFLC